MSCPTGELYGYEAKDSNKDALCKPLEVMNGKDISKDKASDAKNIDLPVPKMRLKRSEAIP